LCHRLRVWSTRFEERGGPAGQHRGVRELTGEVDIFRSQRTFERSQVVNPRWLTQRTGALEHGEDAAHEGLGRVHVRIGEARHSDLAGGVDGALGLPALGYLRAWANLGYLSADYGDGAVRDAAGVVEGDHVGARDDQVGAPG